MKERSSKVRLQGVSRREVYNIKELLIKAFAKDVRKQQYGRTEWSLTSWGDFASPVAVYSRVRREGYVGGDKPRCALAH